MKEEKQKPLSNEELTEYLRLLSEMVKRIGTAVEVMETGAATVAECARVGEIQLQSTKLRSDQLLNLVVSAIKNKPTAKYLGLLEKKKLGGSGVG